MSFKNVDIESALRRLAERRIEEAMREGKFDNLAGALPHCNYRVYISGNGISLVSSRMQRQLFALSFCLSQTDGRHS